VLSVRTVETHRANIQSKLGTSSRSELVRYALDHGLVER
jgi:two-component system, NarL family, response regulator NreC